MAMYCTDHGIAREKKIANASPRMQMTAAPTSGIAKSAFTVTMDTMWPFCVRRETCHQSRVAKQDKFGPIHLAQDEAIRMGGFHVKNTLIDSTPVEPEGDIRRQRSHSAPPGRRQLREEEKDMEDDGLIFAPMRHSKRSITSSSSASTTCSESEGAGTANEFDFPCTECALRDLVEHECSFLRIQGHKLHTKVSKRAGRRGIKTTLRFYVHNLPSAKRAKWLLPLLRAVAALLQPHGCAAMVRGGELYAPVSAGIFVRIDFAPAQH